MSILKGVVSGTNIEFNPNRYRPVNLSNLVRLNYIS